MPREQEAWLGFPLRARHPSGTEGLLPKAFALRPCRRHLSWALARGAPPESRPRSPLRVAPPGTPAPGPRRPRGPAPGRASGGAPTPPPRPGQMRRPGAQTIAASGRRLRETKAGPPGKAGAPPSAAGPGTKFPPTCLSSAGIGPAGEARAGGGAAAAGPGSAPKPRSLVLGLRGLAPPRGRTWRRSRRAANRAGPRPGGAGRGPVGGAGQGGALQPGRGEGWGAVSPATGPGSSSLPAPHFPARVIFFLPRDEPSPSSRAQDPVWLWTECKATLNGTTAHPGCDSVSPCCEMGADKTVVTPMAVLQRSLRSRSRPTAHPQKASPQVSVHTELNEDLAKGPALTHFVLGFLPQGPSPGSLHPLRRVRADQSGGGIIGDPG